ncbi:sulfotransferase [Pseudomonas taiwanensis]|uniref:sulfotransferase n=1 Tax=Pseudomonas taiwanensis TaxID=470150 RepID=UPI0015C1126E|nr:sulfotransferase [Pseudomonas taiwanensis]
MQLDFLVGGMPRGGTTVAAILMSLQKDIFCYAGETHLLPLIHSMFGSLPCRKDRLGPVIDYLHRQLTISMIEMPRFNVGQGTHPANIIFHEHDVDFITAAIRERLECQMFGEDLYRSSLSILRERLGRVMPRPFLGEKTPSNIFAMSDFDADSSLKKLVVVREPFGVLRSMKARVEGGDAYSDLFKGDIEAGIGMYLEYGEAAQKVMKSSGGGFSIRYEDMAKDPAAIVKDMYSKFGVAPEDRVIDFVNGKIGREGSEFASVSYKRFDVKCGIGSMSSQDAWKVLALTRNVRAAFGYTDDVLADYGYDVGYEFEEIGISTKVVPMSGFHLEEANPWMKRKARMVVYAAERCTHTVNLQFMSIFPQQIPKDVELRLELDGLSREVARVGAGRHVFSLEFKIEADDLKPMGRKGGFTIIDLIASMAFVPIAHMDDSFDAREVSFRLVKTHISKNM